MEYVYPAIFQHNSDGSYTITFPDIPGCISEGKSLSNALYMAQSGLKQMLEVMKEEGETFPQASALSSVNVAGDAFAQLVRAELKDAHAVKRTVSIPKWMDEGASRAQLSLSRVLQDALSAKLA